MRGSDFVKTLPEGAGPRREGMILDAFRNGFGMPIQWVPIQVCAGPIGATLQVAADVLAIGEGTDWMRMAVNATTAQLLADHFGALLPTSRISDLAWQHADVRLLPHPMQVEGMSRTSHFAAHHRWIEQQRWQAQQRGAASFGLVSTVGKDWILSRRCIPFPNYAVNYGWHRADGTPIQAKGDERKQPFHDRWHVDYSQWAPRLVYPTMLVDGVERLVADALVDPVLHPLVSDEGPIPISRMPGVPREET